MLAEVLSIWRAQLANFKSCKKNHNIWAQHLTGSFGLQSARCEDAYSAASGLKI